MKANRYSKWTVRGDKKTGWICGCFLTVDDYFKFCDKHNETLKRAIQEQVDELDMTRVVEGEEEGDGGGGDGDDGSDS